MRTADAFVASEYMLIKLNTPAHRVFGFPSSCERGSCSFPHFDQRHDLVLAKILFGWCDIAELRMVEQTRRKRPGLQSATQAASCSGSALTVCRTTRRFAPCNRQPIELPNSCSPESRCSRRTLWRPAQTARLTCSLRHECSTPKTAKHTLAGR